MTVREQLEACKGAVEEINAITDLIDWLNQIGPAQAGSSWPRRDKIPGRDAYVFAAHSTNRSGDAAEAQITDCEAYLVLKRDAIRAKLLTMERHLNRLDDASARTILRRYYEANWTDDEIARELKLSRETVMRKRIAAVNFLESAS